jgi:hypothetical protein
MKRAHAHLKLLPTLSAPIPPVVPSTRKRRRPSTLPTMASAGRPRLYGIALALVLVWLLVLTWRVQALHG